MRIASVFFNAYKIIWNKYYVCGCCSENITPIPPVVRGVYFSIKMINIFYKIIPPYPLSTILLTSYTSHIPTHHPSYLNNFYNKLLNKIMFWLQSFTSRRSKDDFWILQHRLSNPQPVPKKHAINLNQKLAISFSIFSSYY